MRIFNPGDPFFRYAYDVEAFLGEGASGQVFKIRHRLTGDALAVKVGHVEQPGDAKEVKRRLAEGRATYHLHHHNVVRVVDMGLEPGGIVWLIMELLDGQSVEERLVRHGRFSPIMAIDVAVEVASGLHEVHEHQIIHRDVHPGNVMITAGGVVKLLDFSLAKVTHAEIETTREHRAKGTLAYMSPEQLLSGTPTPQFDVFALGVMLWQMLVGRVPFAGCGTNPIHLVQKQLNEDPEPLVTAAGLPAYCDEVIRGATAKDPRRRYRDMWALLQALQGLRARLLADPAVPEARNPPVWERQHPIARHPDGHQQYRPPKSLPRESPAPPIPSRRIVVSPGATAARAVADTVPMAAVDAPRRRAPEAAAPTMPGRARSRPRVGAVGAALVVVAGLAVAWSAPTSASRPTRSSTSTS